MSWKTTGKKERDKAKFIKTGQQIKVNVEVNPTSTTVEGKYGKRHMYIIDTQEFGLIYVTPMQMIRIADEIGDISKGYVVTST